MNISATLGAAKQVATSKVGLAVLKGKTHSPAVLFGVGVVGIVSTVVLSSRATLKVSEVLDDFEQAKQTANTLKEDSPSTYTEDMHKHDMVVLHARMVMDLGKLYAPSLTLGCLSIAALGGSHVILTKRNAALTAALSAVNTAFNGYRSRVREELGSDKDLEFMYGVSEREETVTTKTGATKTVKTKTAGDCRSPYAKLFASDNFNYQSQIEANGWFLRLVQNHCNDRLKAKGYILLNDVYRELGLDDTEAGCVVGWIYDADGAGDQYVDFNCWKEGERGGINPFNILVDGSILLDFNVDGPIFKRLGNSPK